MRRLLALCALALAGCTDDDQLATICVDNSGCREGFICRVETGECLCDQDVAGSCDGTLECSSPGSCFCNTAGYCQPRNACESNADCGAGLFCDLSSGNCIEAVCPGNTCQRCTQDIHCPIGQVCDQIQFQCVPGCRDTGDCKLAEVCRCPGGAPTCSIGSCVAGRCDTIDQCTTGQDCLTDPALSETTCQRDPRMDVLCQPCPTSPASAYECPGIANACFADSEDTDQPYPPAVCGVDCAGGKSCPQDFVCGDLFARARRDRGCSRDQDCYASRLTCQTQEDCPGGSWCNTIDGRCHGKCFTTSEAGVEGFCSCVVNEDCQADFCDTARGVCNLNVKTCTSNADCKSYCVNFPDVGLCKIGEQCRPKPGFTCAQLRDH